VLVCGCVWVFAGLFVNMITLEPFRYRDEIFMGPCDVVRSSGRVRKWLHSDALQHVASDLISLMF